MFLRLCLRVPQSISSALPALPCSAHWLPTVPPAPFSSPARSSQTEWHGTMCAAWLHSREVRRISRGGNTTTSLTPTNLPDASLTTIEKLRQYRLRSQPLKRPLYPESCGPWWRFSREWGPSWTSASDLPRGTECWGKSPRFSPYHSLPPLPTSCS